MNVVFVDRDGTLIREPEDQQVDSLGKLELIPGVIRGLSGILERGFALVMVTNQDDLGSSRYPSAAYDLVQRKLLTLLDGEGIRFDKVFVCPHTAQAGCSCRKPKTGLVEDYLRTTDVDVSRSFMVGDRETDVAFGKAIGVRTILLSTDDAAATEADARVSTFADVVRSILSVRKGSVKRTTSETDIVVDVTLDGTGTYAVDTGLGFFDHMLSLLVKHSGIDARILTRGDLHVDEHHTVEDTGLALGEALRQALGNKLGIERYGFVLPMDEAEASVSIDLSGRPFLAFDVPLSRERLGEVPTELFEDFFRAFSDGLRATVHIRATGRNEHHIVEACFKSVGRSLKDAVSLNMRMNDILPSTKGVL